MKKVSWILAASLISGGVLCGCSQDGSQGIDGSRAASGNSPDATSSATASSAGTAQRRRVDTFANLPDRGDLLDYRQGATRRSGAYTWHAAALSEDHAINAIVSGQMTVTAPDGTPIKLQYDRHIEHPQGNWTWVGHTADGGQALITFGPTAAFGSIPQGGGEAPLRLTMSDGHAWIVATDTAMVRELDIEATDPTGPDYLIPPKLAAAGLGSMGLDSAGVDATGMLASEISTVAAAPAAAGTVVDLLVGYTNGYAADLGGQAAARTRIQNLVDVTNQAYANSQIDARVRLVHAMQVNYSDTTDNGDALEALTGFQAPSTPIDPDPAFAGLRAARDQYGADLVTLVRKFNTPENGGCGIAWLIGGGQSGINSNDEFFGYSVVSDGQDEGTDGTYFCRNETFAHELGHLMGSQHDVETAKGDDGVLDGDDYGAYPYSFGYETAPTTGDFYTVMAYGDDGQRAFRIFSTPAVGTCADRACGTASQSDNARSLRQTMPTIATFRASNVAPSSRKVPHDVDGDGQSDLLWYRPAGGLLAFWVMDGAGVTRHGGVSVGGTFRVIATGDFNGDGKQDLIWNRPQGDMQYWQGDGANFALRRYFTRYPAGWNLVGTGDINGDGKSDLLWHRASDGRLAYWIMDGPQIVRRGEIAVGGTWRVIAHDDFNGDGKMDLIWSRPQGDMQYWHGDGANFAQRQYFASYPVSWNLVDTADVDGDGRADLLWHRPGVGQFAYWVMNGPTIVRHGGVNIASDLRPLMAGDFDDDGKADLIWNNAAGAMQYWVGDGANFQQRLAFGSYPAGWNLISERD